MSVRYIFPLRQNNYTELPVSILNAAAGKQLFKPVQQAPPPQEPTVQETVQQTPPPLKPTVQETVQQTPPPPKPTIRETVQQTPSTPPKPTVRSQPEPPPARPEIPEYQPSMSPERRPRVGRIAAAAVIVAALTGTGLFLLLHNKGGSGKSSDNVIVTDASGHLENTTENDIVEYSEGYTVDFTEALSEVPTDDYTEPTEEISEELTEAPAEVTYMELSPDIQVCLGQLQMTAKSPEYTQTANAREKLDMIAQKLDKLKEDSLISWRTEDLSGGYLSFTFSNGYNCVWGIACANENDHTKFNEKTFDDNGNRSGLEEGSLELYFCESGCYILTKGDISSLNAGIG